MKTTCSKSVKNAMQKHILDCVLDENENQFTDFELLKKYVQKEFDRVANYPYNLKKIPNNQDRFSDYLCGLPFNFCIYYSDIVEFLQTLDLNGSEKEFSDEKSMHLYHYLIFKEIF